MQKFFLKTVLFLYTLAFSAPFVFAPNASADDIWTMMCNEGKLYEYADVSATWGTTDDAGNVTEQGNSVDPDKQAALIEEFHTEYDPQVTDAYQTGTCGSKNTYTQYIEMGDCTANGQIITELVEFSATNTPLDEKNYTKTVYAGSCCLIGMQASAGNIICDDMRTVYFESYSECNAGATNCEKRTWIIGDSGMGMLKLFVKYVYGWGTATVGSVALVIIIYNGIKISISGVSGDVSAAKDKILQAIMAIALLFLSGLILYTVNPTFFS